MQGLRKVLALSPEEQRLVVKAALLIGLIKLGLKLLPFRTLWAILNVVSRPSFGFAARDRLSPERISWAVMATGRYLLRVRPCLTQALAVRLLLMRRGYPADLHLGVATSDQGPIQAHAWVETGGRIVIGGSTSELQHYTPLRPLDARMR
jgi:hypothetical protein